MRHDIQISAVRWLAALTSCFVFGLLSATAPRVEAQSTAIYQINCGGPLVTPFIADTYATGGTQLTYTNSVTTTGVANAAPPAVYQSARDSATSFSYNFPSLTPNAIYTVRLHFAENLYTQANQRLFNIAINGQSVADNFDIYNSAGAANKALVTSYTATADSNGKIGLALTAVKSNANLCGVEILSSSSLYFPSDQPAPMWALGIIPTDTAANAGGFGPSGADEVNLASGVYENHPGPDVVVPNRIGPSPVFERMYRSKTAYTGYGSPGLSAGWTHNYDITVTSSPNSSNVTLTYPNRAADVLTQGTTNGATTSFTPPVSAPYLVTGTPVTTQQGGTAGEWQNFTVTFKDQSTWIFTPNPALSPYFYQLTTVTDPVGNRITLHYTGTQLTSIADKSGRVILSIGYQNFYQNYGYLSYVTESSDPNNTRSVSYTFNLQSNDYCLSSVSQLYLGSNPADNFPIWTYNYLNIGGQPFLDSVTVPDPSGNINNHSGTVSNAINYNSLNGLISSLVDADQNQRTYNYQAATQVQVLNPAGTQVALSYRQGADSLNRATNVTDGLGNTAYAYYSDLRNPYSPTEMLNRNNQMASATYDQFGNVIGDAVPCNGSTLATAYSYDFSLNTLGKLKSVQEGSRTPSSIVYYQGTFVNGVFQAPGLVKSVSTPLPGSTSYGPTVTTTYVYTTLGNVSSVTLPSAAASGTVTISYNYTYDALGNFQQAEALGEPLTVTIPISATVNAVTHYRYDAHGNVTTVIDANGFETDYQYNTQDQLTYITYPPATTGAVRYETHFTYRYDGGPLSETDLLDAPPHVYRWVVPTIGNEGEATKQTGDTDRSTVTLDPDFRPTTVADGDGSAHAITPSYDAADNLKQILFPNHGANNFDGWTGTYDADGNLTQQLDGLNLTTTFNLAPDDSRLESITYPANTLPSPVYTYDNLGRLTQRVDGSGAFTYEYDELDNLLSTSVTYNVAYTPGVTVPTQTLSYTYYPDGHRQSMTTPQGTYTYSYDMAGRLTDVVFPWTGGSVHYDYDLGGRLTHVGHSKGDTYYTYDNLGRLADLKNQANTTPTATLMSEFGVTDYGGGHIVSTPMQYDAAGNRLTMPFYMRLLSGDPNNNIASGETDYQYETAGYGDRLTKRTWGPLQSTGLLGARLSRRCRIRRGRQPHNAAQSRSHEWARLQQ